MHDSTHMGYLEYSNSETENKKAITRGWVCVGESDCLNRYRRLISQDEVSSMDGWR